MTPEQTILALTAACAILGVLWLHAEWRRFVLGSLSRGALKELKKLQPKH